MNISKLKLSFIMLAIMACSMNVLAQHTVSLKWNAEAGSNKELGILATKGQNFTINWGDGSALETKTGTFDLVALVLEYLSTGEIVFPEVQLLWHTYTTAGSYTVTITGATTLCQINGLDCKIGQVTELNLSGCPNLYGLYCSDNLLTTLNLSNSKQLIGLECSNNLLTTLDISACNGISTPFGEIGFEAIACHDNQLQLSDLYAISEKVSMQEAKLLGTQNLTAKTLMAGETASFAGQLSFGGTSTVFTLTKNGSPAIENTDYTMAGAVITFLNAGNYLVTMTNAAIISSPEYPVQVIAEFIVEDTGDDFVPVTDITDLPEKAMAGEPLTLTGTVIPDDATNNNIVWNIKDAGDTGATITGNVLNTTAGGIVIITATITDGTAVGTNFTKDFPIEVEEEPIEGIADHRLLDVNIFPNPTSGQLQVTSYELQVTGIEVFDVMGKRQKAEGRRQNEILHSPFSILHSFDLSDLPAGVYFIRIQTEKGVVTRKIIKQ